MTNLLALPDRWDFTVPGGNPSWTGTSFRLTNGLGSATVFDMVPSPGVSAPSPGDTFTGEASQPPLAGYGGGALFLNLVSGATVLQSLQLTGTPQFFSWDAYAAGPTAHFILASSASATTPAAVNGQTLLVTPDEVTSYNCDCDEDGPIVTDTLVSLRTRLMRRLGFSAQAASPPPGMAALLDDFLRSEQVRLYNRYPAVRKRRMFTWQLRQGVRFYDLSANRGLCTLKLDGRRIEWAGVSSGDDVWTPIICGIPPEAYTSNLSGIVQRYEVRQCIEVWPAPSDDLWLLRIKGDVGLLPFAADSDRSTIDAEPLFLSALARAKAHYRQPDAEIAATDASALLSSYTAASHGTRRYIPGGQVPPNKTMPRRV